MICPFIKYGSHKINISVLQLCGVFLFFCALLSGNAFSSRAKTGLWFTAASDKPLQIKRSAYVCAHLKNDASWVVRHKVPGTLQSLFWVVPVPPELTNASPYPGGLHSSVSAFAAPGFYPVAQPPACRPVRKIAARVAFDYYADTAKPREAENEPRPVFARDAAKRLNASLWFRQWRPGADPKEALEFLKFNNIEPGRRARKRIEEWTSRGYGLVVVEYKPAEESFKSGGWLPPVRFDFSLPLSEGETWFLLEPDLRNAARLDVGFISDKGRPAPLTLRRTAYPSDYFLPEEIGPTFPDIAGVVRDSLWRGGAAFSGALARGADLTPARYAPGSPETEQTQYRALMDSLAAFAGGAEWLPEELHFAYWTFGGKLAEERGLKIIIETLKPPFRARYYYRLPPSPGAAARCKARYAYDAKVARENLLLLTGWKNTAREREKSR